MNGYSLTDKMKKTRQWVKLTAVEQALFHELVSACNERNWPEVFLCSNKRLCSALRISERSLIRARETLVKTGLLYYRSGKSMHTVSAYSFTTPLMEEETTDKYTVVTPADETDYINKYSIKTPSIPHESERINPVCFLPFGQIKNQLLADEIWKEITAMQSGLSIRFLEILPAQIDNFLQYIVATGEEYTVQTLSNAKRRFFWWWKNQGKKAYESQSENPENLVW